MKKMNILICSEYFYPSIGGAQKVSQELAVNFSNYGHKVTVVTSKHLKLLKMKEKFQKKIKIIRFDIKGNAVRGYKGNIEKYQKFLLKSKFDTILFYAAQQWSFDLALPILDRINSNLYFAPCGFSKLHNIFYKKYFKLLPKYLRKFRVNILHSRDYRDTKFLIKNKITNKVLIPNASDFLFKKRKLSTIKNSQNETINILNVSNLRFAKGQDLAIIIFFFLNIKKKINLILLGNETCSKIYKFYLLFLKFITEFFWKNKTIIFSKENKRSRVISYFYSSDIFLFTSRIECSPLVLFESASAGLPFISFNVGNSVEIAKWTGCGLVFNNFSSILKCIRSLILDKKKINKLSIRGQQNFNKKYNWKTVSERYLNLFKKNNSI